MIICRDPLSLRPHPENARIYGDGIDSDFVESIKKKKVLSPLLITWDDRIIAGHRRREAAIAAGLTEVPVAIYASRDELDILEALVHDNKHREKTNEQFGREAAALLEVETERARLRKEQAASVAGKASGAARRGEANIPMISSERSDAGDARQKVADALEAGPQKVEQAVAVVKKIDALVAAGKVEEARKVKDVLNGQSVNAAFQMTKEAPPPAAIADDAATPSAPAAEPDREAVLSALPHFAAARDALSKVGDLLQSIADTDGGADLRAEIGSKAEKINCAEVNRLRSVLHGARPHCWGCGKGCGNSPKCPACRGRGWMSRRMYQQLSDEEKRRVQVIKE